MSFGSVTAASSGGGGTQLHTTTTKSYDPTSLRWLVCTVDNYGHEKLDNPGSKGITILVGDQHLQAVFTTTGNSVAVMMYSNVNLTEIYEYHMLPCLRQLGEFNSNERGGFSDVFQAAIIQRLEQNLLAEALRQCRSYMTGPKPTFSNLNREGKMTWTLYPASSLNIEMIRK